MAENSKKLKVAFVTDDGTTISAHFGRARFYEVLTIEKGAVKHQERHEKSFHSAPHDDHQSAHDDRGLHEQMFAPIRDCQAVVARGMGSGAFQHLKDANLSPIITTNKTIAEAVREVIDGTIVNHVERLQ